MQFTYEATSDVEEEDSGIDPLEEHDLWTEQFDFTPDPKSAFAASDDSDPLKLNVRGKKVCSRPSSAKGVFFHPVQCARSSGRKCEKKKPVWGSELCVPACLCACVGIWMRACAPACACRCTPALLRV